MAEDQDSRTEEPTSKRLRDAEEKGQIASSQEVKTWIIFLAASFLLLFSVSGIAEAILRHLKIYLDTIGTITFDETGLMDPLVTLVTEVALSISVILATFIVAALIANRLQNKFLFALEKIKPDLSKLSLAKGAKKIFSTNNLVEFLKSIVKMIIVGVTVFLVVYPERNRLDSMMFLEMMDVTALIGDLVTVMFIAVTIALTAIAAIDYSWQTYQHVKNLRMTKQEVKDENKQSDGDPQIKRRLRQIRLNRMSRRLSSVIPEASVVITNPTHFAVALKYDHGKMDVPMVVAKGVDSLAFRIRELAEEHGVPVIENPPLARTLHAAVEIDQEIHPDHYQAVAAVISYILKMEKAGIKPNSFRPQDNTSTRV